MQSQTDTMGISVSTLVDRKVDDDFHSPGAMAV
jgi:hypothetical protein